MKPTYAIGVVVLLYCAESFAQGAPEPLPPNWASRPAPPIQGQRIGCSRTHVFTRDYSGKLASFDGNAWTELPSAPPGSSGHGLAVSPAGEVFLELGNSIGVWDGKRWDALSMPDWTGPIRGMTVLPSGDLVVFGQGRVGLRVGSSISSRDAGTWRDLGAASGTSLRDLWVGGQGGTLLHHTNGWTPFSVAGSVWIKGLFVPAATAGWAWCEGCADARLLAWDGSRWTLSATGIPAPVRGMAGDSTHPWVYGSSFVARLEGKAWVVELSEKHLPSEYSSYSYLCSTQRFLHLTNSGKSKEPWVRAL